MVFGLFCRKHNYETTMWDPCPSCVQEGQNNELIKQAQAQTEELKRQTKLQQDIENQRILDAEWRHNEQEHNEKTTFGTSHQGGTKMNCSNCSHEIILGQKFCSNCGSLVGNFCKSCEAPLLIGAKFCSECGAKFDEGQKEGKSEFIEQGRSTVSEEELFESADWWSSWWSGVGISIYKVGLLFNSDEQDLTNQPLNKIFKLLLKQNLNASEWRKSLDTSDWEVKITLVDEGFSQTQITLCSHGDLFCTHLETAGNEKLISKDMNLKELKDFFIMLNTYGPDELSRYLPHPLWMYES